MVHSIKRCKMALFKKAALAFLRGHAAWIVLVTGAGLRGAGAQDCSKFSSTEVRGKSTQREISVTAKRDGTLQRTSKPILHKTG